MAHCTGYGNCKQGRKPCQTGWACGVRTDNGGESVDTTESTKGLLTSVWFWIGAVLSIALWSGLWELCVAWLRHH